MLEELWRAFEREVPPPPHVAVDEDHELDEIREIVAAGLAFVAETGERGVGFALARRTAPHAGRLTDLYVAPDARRSGVAAALVRDVVEALAVQGVEYVDLEVMAGNAPARAVYQRWGFVEDVVTVVARVDALRERLATREDVLSFASIHVQTDEVGDVERAARAFAPRIGSRRTRVEGPRNGWVAVYDEIVDRDHVALRRFAREISSRMGAIVVSLSLEAGEVVRMIAFERGGIVDEYLSVPEFYEPLPPGDVVGLAANPTVLARIAGADPQAVREVARNAAAPAELPPAAELLERLAAVLGLEGATHGIEP